MTTFVLIAVLPGHDPGAGIAVFALAGLGCSALLPLTISFGENDLSSMGAAAVGGIIAFYQLGFGIAAFGVGPLVDSGVELVNDLRVHRHRRRGVGRSVLRR